MTRVFKIIRSDLGYLPHIVSETRVSKYANQKSVAKGFTIPDKLRRTSFKLLSVSCLVQLVAVTSFRERIVNFLSVSKFTDQ